MRRHQWLTILAASIATCANAQSMAPARPSSDMIQRMQLEENTAKNLPDTPGSGPYPAIKEELASLPEHVVYRPANLAKVVGKLPIIAWGNGGCSSDGASTRFHLLELASHGYLVIANGTVKSGPGTHPTPPRPALPPGQFAPAESSATDLVMAIDWAIAQNETVGSPLTGRINTKAVAVSGWSCGGLQALAVATSDPRVTTAVIQNSGILPVGAPAMPGMEIGKSALDKLRAPILYILGGPGDIAYANGIDDFKRIHSVPAAAISVNVGHTGTYFRPNGGKAAQAAVAWFDWWLKKRKQAAKWFVGPNCDLCRDPEWKIERKGF